MSSQCGFSALSWHLTCRVSSTRKRRNETREETNFAVNDSKQRLSQASVCDELLDPVRATAMKRNWDVNDMSEMRSGGVSWTTSAISSESDALGHRQTLDDLISSRSIVKREYRDPLRPRRFVGVTC